MKFDQAAEQNPIDQLKVVGKPTDRIDGPRKTSGTAPYAYERHDVALNQTYGDIVGAAIANAVYNATGVRVRDYPITLDKHLAKLPLVA